MKTIGRWLYLILSIAFLVCILTQFFLAGMAIFDGGQYWTNHRMLVHLFGWNLPIIMMLGAFMGNAKKNDYFSILCLFFLIFLMYASANIGFKLSFMGALHPILGILLVIVSIHNIKRSLHLLKNKGNNI